MKSKILISILSLILFVFGFYYYQNFQELFLSIFKNIKFFYRDFDHIFIQAIWFGISLAFLPILIFILFKRCEISNLKSQLTVFASFFTAIVSAISLKNVQINFAAKNSYTPLNADTIFDYPAEKINYSLFIMILELLTFCLLIFFLKKK